MVNLLDFGYMISWVLESLWIDENGFTYLYKGKMLQYEISHRKSISIFENLLS